MNNNQVDLTEYKIILLGESNVGKTTLSNKFIFNKDKYDFTSTISIDNETKIIEYKNNKYSITLYDTAGQERFRCITQAYYRLADGFFIMFDLTNEHSLTAIKDWIESIQYDDTKNKFLILGNKNDLDNKISDDEINNTLGEYKNLFLKTSAIENKNIKEAFEKMIDLIEDESNAEKLKEKKLTMANSFYIKQQNHTKNSDSNNKNNQCC